MIRNNPLRALGVLICLALVALAATTVPSGLLNPVSEATASVPENQGTPTACGDSGRHCAE
jgi:hypothetical protein